LYLSENFLVAKYPPPVG